MDIDKICRTCLGLSGPLLSIYDDGPGCVAEMLSNFTRLKPKLADKLPEKVCLTCISEINRCYSFKIKVENSNRTLRQLIPDSLPEEQSDIVVLEKRTMCNQAVQTIAVPQVTTAVAQVQTDSIKLKTTNVFKQDPSPSSAASKVIKNSPVENAKRLKSNRKTEEPEGTNFSSNTNKRVTRSTANNKNDSVTNTSKKQQPPSPTIEIDDDDHEYIVELHDNMIADDDDVQLLSDQGNQMSGSTTYYEISVPNYKLESAQNTEKDGVISEYNDEDLEFICSNLDNVGQGDFKFTICNSQQNNDEENVKKSIHIPKKTSRIEFKCPECIMTFVSDKNLRRHLVHRHSWTAEQAANATILTPDKGQHVIEQEFLFMEMDEKSEKDRNLGIKSNSPNEESLTRDTVIAEETTPSELQYFCEYCNAGFAMLNSLRYHKKMGSCNLLTYTCDECERVFVSEKNLEDHKALHILDNACVECKEVLSNQEELNKHMVEKHNRNLRNQCPTCKKIFTMASALKDHMRTHSGEKPFVCTTCGRKFSQNANLRQHMLRHLNTKKFKCDLCGSAYVTKAELFSHQRVHTRDQPFKCEYCNTSFSTSSSLLKHRRKHTGERPYACDICPLRFMSLNVLKNHRRTHTGEKPYKCTFCKKAFTQKNDCLIHQRTHTGERNYICPCGESFTHNGTLRRHLALHQKDAAHQRKTRKRSNSMQQLKKIKAQTIESEEEDVRDEESIELCEEELMQLTEIDVV